MLLTRAPYPEGVDAESLTTPDSRGGLKKSRDWACVSARREEPPAPGAIRCRRWGAGERKRKCIWKMGRVV